jgi:hypothetical protein
MVIDHCERVVTLGRGLAQAKHDGHDISG